MRNMVSESKHHVDLFLKWDTGPQWRRFINKKAMAKWICVPSPISCAISSNEMKCLRGHGGHFLGYIWSRWTRLHRLTCLSTRIDRPLCRRALDDGVLPSWLERPPSRAEITTSAATETGLLKRKWKQTKVGLKIVYVQLFVGPMVSHYSFNATALERERERERRY